MAHPFAPRRYARMAKRAVRLLTGKDVLYKMDVRPKKRHVGSVYGGWMLVPELLNAGSVVYSVGVGDDISFDLEMIRQFGCKVYGFDPSPEAVQWLAAQEKPSAYVFHPWALGTSDGVAKFYEPVVQGLMSSLQPADAQGGDGQKAVDVPVYRLATIAEKLGTPAIDLLKMDIEGTEYELIEELASNKVPVKQLMIEFHHRIGVKSLQATVDAVDRLRTAGFQLFHVSETSSEFSFLHTSAS